MLTVSEAQKRKTELTEKINLVTSSIDEKRKELESLKRSNARLVEASLSRKRMPGSLHAQRQQISKLTQEIEELERAKSSIEEKLSIAKEELSFAQLFQQAKVFTESEETFFNRINEIAVCMSDIAEGVQKYKKLVEQLKTDGHPLIKFQEILKELQGKLSYEGFFSKGEMTEPNMKDNDFLDRSISKYRNLRNDLPGLDDLNLISLVLYNQLQFISRQASELRIFRLKD